MSAASSVLPAQTFVVDSSNGPGTHFTDLPAAVAAVPSGAALLVRPGSYTPFSISNKSLRVIGQRSGTGAFPSLVPGPFAPNMVIGPLAGNQSVSISGLNPAHSSISIPPFRFTVQDCAGPVLLEDMVMSFQVPLTMTIRNSTNVHCARLTLSAFVVDGPTPPEPPLVVQDSSVEFMRLVAGGYRQAAQFGVATAAMQITRSRVMLVNPDLFGGAGLGSGSVGGPAIVATSSLLHAYGNAGNGTRISIVGGSGAFSQPGAGGDGLVLRQSSFARVHGISPRGGFGTPSGQPFSVDASSTLEHAPSAIAPTAQVDGVVQPGNTVEYVLFAKPGVPAGLWIALGTQFQMLPILTLGAVGVNPIFTVGVGNVPASGRLAAPSLVPAGFPTAAIVLAQFVVFDPSNNQLALSNVCTATSRF